MTKNQTIEINYGEQIVFCDTLYIIYILEYLLQHFVFSVPLFLKALIKKSAFVLNLYINIVHFKLLTYFMLKSYSKIVNTTLIENFFLNIVQN